MATVATMFTAARYDLRDFGAQNYDDTQLIEYLNRAIKLMDSVLIARHSDLLQTHTYVKLDAEANRVALPTNTLLITRVYIDSDRLTQDSLDHLLYRKHYNESRTVMDTSDWTASGDEYYQTLSVDPEEVYADATALTEGTVASLAEGEWGYDSDNSRLYVRPSDDADPADLLVVAINHTQTTPEFWSYDGNYIYFDLSADQDYLLKVEYLAESTAITATTDSMPYHSYFDDVLREATVEIARAAKEKKSVDVNRMFRRKFEETVDRFIVGRWIVKPTYQLDF